MKIDLENMSEILEVKKFSEYTQADLLENKKDVEMQIKELKLLDNSQDDLVIFEEMLKEIDKYL